MPAKYVLTPEILAQSQNEMVLKLRNSKNEFAWVKDARMEIGWTDFVKDVTRNIKLNHGKLEDEAKELLLNIEHALSQKADKRNFSALTENIKTLLDIDPEDEDQAKQVEALLLHYSQAPNIFMATTLGNFFMGKGSLVLKGPASEEGAIAADVNADIYMDQGKINLKIKINKLPIVDIEYDGAKVLYLEGPIEGLFEMDLDKGFVLKHISTDSKYIADLYMKDNEEFFALIKKFQDLETKFLIENEKLAKQIETNPREASEYMRHKRHIEVVLESLDDYRKRKITYERLTDRVRYHSGMMNEISPALNKAYFYPLWEVLDRLAPKPNEPVKDKVMKASHSTFSSPKEEKQLVERGPIPFHFKEAKGLMRIASDAAIELVKKFRDENPEPLTSGMFSRSVTAAGGEHDLAKKLQKAASRVFQEENKMAEYSDVDLLRNYLSFVTTLLDVVQTLDMNSKLLADINASKTMITVGESLGVLIWKKLDVATVSKIEASLKGHVEWMQSILPDQAESLKGKLQ